MATSALKKTAQRTGPVIDRTSSIPADDLAAWMEEDTANPEPEPSAPRKSSGKAATAKESAPAKESAVVATGPPLEPVIRRLMASEHKSHFLLLADWFESAIGKRKADVCVEADVGDIFFEVIDWIQTPGFLKLVVDGSRMPFKPKAMGSMRIRRNGEVYQTTCVSPLSPMFGDLPFAELILVVDGVQNLTQEKMEKNARITPGVTPSAVSGKPSTSVDNDEPVADGEKAASARGALPEQDFDVSREHEED